MNAGRIRGTDAQDYIDSITKENTPILTGWIPTKTLLQGFKYTHAPRCLGVPQQMVLEWKGVKHERE